MIMMGMVSRYSDETATGTVVLRDGDIREFKRTEWVDKEWEPGLGQQVLYKTTGSGTQIRTITNEEFEEIKSNPEKAEPEEQNVVEDEIEESSPSHQFTSAEDAIEHYKELGFRVALDKEEDGERTISMRFYYQGEFGEALITVKSSNIEIFETRNGEPI